MKAPSSSVAFALQDFLPFLMNRAGVKTGQVFSEDLRQFGLTMFEWRVLVALWGNEGLRLNDIAEIVVADLSTTSRQVRGLDDAGLIKRTSDGADKRALCLELTPKGRRLISQIIPISQLHERVATNGLAPADLAIMRRCLQTIFENLVSFEADRLPKRGRRVGF